MQAILVVQRGAILAEHYFRGRRADDRTNLHSLTKSFVSALAGIAISQHLLTLDTSIAELLPDATFADAAGPDMTVRHLLTMTAGLQADGGHDIDEIGDRGESWALAPLAAPRVTTPGAAFLYNNGAVHALAVILDQRTGGLLDWAQQVLFDPMEIPEVRWATDPDGHPLGYGHLEMRPRDLLAFGQLYLCRGAYHGRTVVPSDWVELTTRAVTGGGDPEGVPYGYLWWIDEFAGFSGYFAGGFGGQYIVVVPDLEAVVVTVADVDVWIPSAGSPLRLIREEVVPQLV